MQKPVNLYFSDNSLPANSATIRIWQTTVFMRKPIIPSRTTTQTVSRGSLVHRRRGCISEFRVTHHNVGLFDIPRDWKRFRSCDYGYSSYSAVHWFAINPNFETLYVYRELYVSKHTGRDLAKAVIQAEINNRVPYGILDSSCWHNRGQIGPSIAEEMI